MGKTHCTSVSWKPREDDTHLHPVGHGNIIALANCKRSNRKPQGNGNTEMDIFCKAH